MDAPDALATIAEIAIAIAGFSGVAAVLGRRSQGEWTPEDVIRFRALLISSFAIVVLCFLPIVLSLTALAPSLVWALSSGAWLVYLVPITAIRFSEARRVSRTNKNALDRRAIVLMAAIGLAVILLNGTNIFILRSAWPYVAATVCSLTVPFAFFFRLLRTILRADADDA